ncbi:MAG: hypothetical protein SF066_23725 [Thermoanaerobaculia bacterium]|nr:hypothetical protein [Thermoanaerobaculia bacterium]
MKRTLWSSMLAALALALLLVSPVAALKPAPCDDVHRPVLCYSDGFIYWNICFANAAGAALCVPYDPRVLNFDTSTLNFCSNIEAKCCDIWSPACVAAT